MPDMTARLARLRVPLGFVVGALALWAASPTRASLAAGGAIALVGEALRVWAAGHLTKSSEVTTSGPYRWFAHPLYVGSSIIAAGIAVASARLSVALLVAVYLIVTIGAAIVREEAFLKARFGDGYDSYRCGRAAFVAERSGRRFSLARARANGEHRAVVGWLVAALLLWSKAAYNGVF
jgi:hypothetical protein